jgi:hypothetical protein
MEAAANVDAIGHNMANLGRCCLGGVAGNVLVGGTRAMKTENAFGAYLLAQSEARTAYEGYNFAAMRLANARIMERLAEIKSQHEPLATVLGSGIGPRECLYAAAFYVVVGRLPEP